MTKKPQPPAMPVRKSFTFLLDETIRERLEAAAATGRRSLAQEVELRLGRSLAREDFAEMIIPLLEIIFDPEPSMAQRARAADLLRWITALSQEPVATSTFETVIQARLGRPGLANFKKWLGEVA